jgi:hypothetical protein
LILKLRSHKTTLLLLLPTTATLDELRQEIATALNDTSYRPKQVSAADITVYKRTNGQWSALEKFDKAGKPTRATTLEEFDLHGVGSGSTVDDDGEVLGYTVQNGLEGEDKVEYEAYPRDD